MTNSGDERSLWRRMSISSYVLIVVLLVALVAVILYLIPVNEYVLLPGQAMPVAPMIAIKGHPAHSRGGQLLMTDVSLYQANHLLEDLFLRLNSNADFEPASTVAGNLSAAQFNKLNFALMDTSIQAAETAALSQVPGYHPRLAPTGPRIVFVFPGKPAAHGLHAGDVILRVDGRRTRQATAVSPVIKALPPGHAVHFELLRAGHRVDVTTGSYGAKQKVVVGKRTITRTETLVGIEVEDQVVFPVKVSIDPGDIGGPSAGLMFSLGIIQRLEQVDITHGCRVAGTGTIDGLGNVGPIGGAKQKIIAARDAGARYFLVPDVPDNLQPALQNRGNITVVPVRTLAGALAYLKRLSPCR